jgi:hypothetical protein
MGTEAALVRSPKQKPYRQLATAKTVLIAVGIGALGLLLLWLAGLDLPWESLKALLNNLGSALIVSVALALIWELSGRRAFTREILESAKTVGEIDAAGLLNIGNNYVEDPDWEEFFRTVSHLDIFVAYARTWRNQHYSRLKSLAARPNSRIRIYLPDPSDEATIRHLADRFAMDEDALIAAIMEASRAFKDLDEGQHGNVEIYYRKGDLVFSCYKFDAKAIITLYSHGQRRTGVPTIVCRRGGTLFQFVADELDAIHRQSRPVE